MGFPETIPNAIYKKLVNDVKKKNNGKVTTLAKIATKNATNQTQFTDYTVPPAD